MSMMSASHTCLHVRVCVCVCRPVVCVGEVVYDCGADAGHAPLAVVASSCDDRQLRSTQALLRRYAKAGRRRTHKNNAPQNTTPHTGCHGNQLLILHSSEFLH